MPASRRARQPILRRHGEILLTQFTLETAQNETRPTAIVIAAPLKASAVAEWMALQSTPFVKVLDLRGEAETDPLTCPLPVIRLSEMFAAVKNDRPKLAARVAAAREEIRKAAQRLIEQAQFRPFGWEDLCA